MNPRSCRYLQRETYHRRQCGTCRSVDEASFRLYTWVGSQGGERLVTEGGAAEEGSSPPRPEDQNVDQEQEQQSEVTRMEAEPSTQPATHNFVDGGEAEDESIGINLDYLDLRQLRPLSGSTIASSCTLPTAIGSSTVPSKRQSSGKPRETPASMGDSEVSAPFQPFKARGVGNPSGDYSNAPAPTTLDSLSDENAAPTATTGEGRAAQQTPNIRHSVLETIDRPAEDDSDAPLNVGALKRTISILSFNELDSETRTAFPASEATDVPPAYARPRSEVGLPPLLPGVTEDTEMEDAEDTDDDGEEMAGSSKSSS